jgi:DNA-directed RNA polymerase subunit RPC12/RpoP
MKTNNLLLLFSPHKWICSFVGHRLQVSKNITDHIKEYKCERCGHEMTDTANGFLDNLTPKFRETNAFLAKIHERRCSRKVFNKQGFSRAS